MKKILLINDHIHFGGGGDAVFRFEKETLQKARFDIYTLSFGNSSESNEKNLIIDSIHSNVKSKLNKFLSSVDIEKKITKLIYKISPDLIHIHLISKFPLAIYNSSALNSIPVIQTLHGPNLFCTTSWGGLKNSGSCELGIGLKCFTRGCSNFTNTILYSQLKLRYWYSLKNKIDLFHCPSLNILNDAKRLGLKKSKYIPLGIDEIFHEEPNSRLKERPTLLYVGAIAEQKGVRFLLPALKTVKKTFPNVLLRVAGRGNLLPKLKQEAKQLDLDNNVEFLGFIAHDKIRDFYVSGDIFLMPSIWQEQFGLVGPEAMACNVPCIASNVGGIPEWLKHNENGLLVPPQDIDELSDAIIYLLQNPEIRIEMGRRGREFALKEFGSGKYANNLLNMINQYI